MNTADPTPSPAKAERGRCGPCISSSVSVGQEWVGRRQGFCPPALASRGGEVLVQTASPSTGCLVRCLRASPLLGGYTEDRGKRTPHSLWN